MKAPPHFVVFEGLDGSGKTTCAKLTAQALNAEYVTTPSPAIRKFREAIIDDFGDCQEARQLFYLATVFAASREVGKLLSSGRSVVLDRYFLSTQAYAAFRGSALAIDEVGQLLLPADLTVFLGAPLSVRRARIIERGGSPDDRETLTPEADARLRREHQARSCLPVVGKFVSIDTSSAAISDVVATVVAEMRHFHVN